MTLSPRLIAAAALALALFAAGWLANGWRLNARIARMETDQATALLAAQQAAKQALDRAIAAERDGQALAGRAAEAEAAASRTGREKDDAIRKLSARRPCLNANVVSVLNNELGGANTGGVPPPAGGAARPAPGAPPDSGNATDEDIAIWARYAIERYNLCRGRIDALNEFHRPAPND
ncbi:MAG: hypothetical protein LBI68_11030 [Azoarcus sp.]|nr:hypothetical protein [Azoarcus sp.]